MNAKQKHDLKIVVRLLPRLFLIFGSLTIVIFALFDPAGKKLVRNSRAQLAQLYGQASAAIAGSIKSREDAPVAPIPQGGEIPVEVSIEELALRKRAVPTAPDTAPPLPLEPAPAEGTVPVSSPTEQPRLTLEDVIQTPQRWPRTVVLKVPVVFPAIVSGRVVGTVKAPAGVGAKPLGVQAGLITVQYQGGTKVLPLASTDFVEQVEQMLARSVGGGATGVVAAESDRAPTNAPPSEPADARPGVPTKLSLLISTERKRFEVERTKTSSSQNTVESWGYTIAVVNKSFADLPDVEIRYQMVMKDDSPGTTTAARVERKSGSKTCELLKNNTTFAFDTEPVELTKTQLGSGYVYGNGARARSKDSLVGVMIRAYHDGNVIAEFSEPAALRTKEKWE